MKNRFDVRGPLAGYCAICGALGPLTEDHVPPKKASRLANVQMADLWKRLQAEPEVERPPKYSQNGVKFRSICSTCNNVRLGAECDPALIRFTSEVAAVITHLETSPLVLPLALSIKTQPTTVLRSIVGHTLAINGARKPAGEMELALAEFFLDPSRPPDRALDCLYWLYPYNDQVFIQSAVISHALGSGKGGTYFKLLKFYPLAFMLTWKRNDRLHMQLRNLCDHRNVRYEDEAEVAIDTLPPPHQLWPEVPTGHSAVMYAGRPKIAEARPPKSPVHRK